MAVKLQGAGNQSLSGEIHLGHLQDVLQISVHDSHFAPQIPLRSVQCEINHIGRRQPVCIGLFALAL